MDQYIDSLKNSGFKITPKRLAIIELFLKENRVLTPDEVWVPLKKDFGQLGLPSVYRNLESLVECGVLTKIHQFDNKRYYGLCHAPDHTHHHHHIVCTTCGKVGEFEGCQLTEIKKIKGFKVLRHFVQLEGLCTDCQP
ncbi:MAG: Fur family transcriptional regulator [Candidatus Omnitrophota bacterium]